jgi:hypothetical protein
VSNTVAYDIYMRADASYVYVLLQSLPAGLGHDAYEPGLNFANLYFSTYIPNGSNVGFEVENDRAFVPGPGGYYNGLDALGFEWSLHTGTTYANGGEAMALELAMPWSYFVNDPQHLNFPKIEPGDQLQFRISQSFGYSAAGGASYDPTRLGMVSYQPTPEPVSAGLIGLGLAGLGVLGLRRRS